MQTTSKTPAGHSEKSRTAENVIGTSMTLARRLAAASATLTAWGLISIPWILLGLDVVARLIESSPTPHPRSRTEAPAGIHARIGSMGQITGLAATTRRVRTLAS